MGFLGEIKFSANKKQMSSGDPRVLLLQLLMQKSYKDFLRAFFGKGRKQLLNSPKKAAVLFCSPDFRVYHEYPGSLLSSLSIFICTVADL